MRELSVQAAYELVQQAFNLSSAASEYVKNAGKEVPIQEIFEKVFLPSGMVDVAKTQKESGNPPKIFLTSPYGLQYRPEYKDWIPFRHGDIKLTD
jgi:hypothetical protein